MKKKLFLMLPLLIMAVIALPAQDATRKSVNVTVYNGDLGVIRDIRQFDIKSGTSEIILEDVAERIDPTSVHIKLDGSVLEQNFKYDLVSMYKILSKYLDKKIALTSKEGTYYEGVLLSINANQIVLKKDDGGLLMLPKIDDYQISVGKLPEGLITKPALVWTVAAKAAKKQDVEVTYQTSGLSWNAEYVAVLNKDDSKMDLNSWVSITNSSGATYPDAKLKLVAGDVNRVQDFMEKDGIMFAKADMAEGARQFEEKAFFEYHIYDLQRQSTIANNENKQISLFEASDVSIKKKFVLTTGQWNAQKQKVQVMVEFENKAKNNLGMPMPKGKVRLYKSDGESVEFIGEDRIDHTAKDETVKLKVGEAFDVVADIKTLSEKKITDKVYENSYSVKIRNHKTEAIEVEVFRNLGSYWQISETNINYEKKDANNVVFKVPVKADGEFELLYTVKYRY